MTHEIHKNLRPMKIHTVSRYQPYSYSVNIFIFCVTDFRPIGLISYLCSSITNQYACWELFIVRYGLRGCSAGHLLHGHTCSAWLWCCVNIATTDCDSTPVLTYVNGAVYIAIYNSYITSYMNFCLFSYVSMQTSCKVTGHTTFHSGKTLG